MKDGFYITGSAERQMYPNYKYTKKEVEINSKSYKANFIKPHTRIKGIIYEWEDKNAPDRPWANICDWHLTFFVLWKDVAEWEPVYYNAFSQRNGVYDYGHGAGLNQISFCFETDKFKKKFIKEKRIKELQSKIKDYTKELLNLTQGEEHWHN